MKIMIYEISLQINHRIIEVLCESGVSWTLVFNEVHDVQGPGPNLNVFCHL